MFCFELKIPNCARKKNALRLLESKELRRVCGPEGQEVAGGCSKLRTKSRVS